MIIIEGTDGVGKTTLARELQKQLRCAYVHYGLLPEWWCKEAYVSRLLEHSVYDRYHWSEAAYSEVVGRRPVVVANDCREIDRTIRRVIGKRAYTSVLLITRNSSYFDNRIDSMYDMDVVRSVNNWFDEHEHDFDLVYDVTHRYPDAQEIARLHLQRERLHHLDGTPVSI